MGSSSDDDDRIFNGDFSEEGVVKLKERVKVKLKEYMGDYTDDILVEYVIVLLKNGRRREEAKNELKIFLSDDSDSFVSWLWDHLGESVDEYFTGSHVEQKKMRSSPELRTQENDVISEISGNNSASWICDSDRVFTLFFLFYQISDISISIFFPIFTSTSC